MADNRKKTGRNSEDTAHVELGDSPDWGRMEREVILKLRILRAAWEHTAPNPELHQAMARDLYLPVLRLLAEFCNCVKEQPHAE